MSPRGTTIAQRFAADLEDARLPRRFWSKVSANDLTGCWEWVGGKQGDGYGTYWDGSRVSSAHRVAYRFFVGEVAKGLELDHTCRVRACVNPAHLEAVTHQENVRRSPTVGRWRKSLTHCKHGHEFTEENTYRDPRRPSRRACKTCHRVRQQAARAEVQS